MRFVTRQNIILITIFILLVAAGGYILYLMSPTAAENTKKGEVKDKVSKQIGRSDFDVTQIVVESDGWQLAKLASTGDDDKGNPALVILHKENGQMVLRFGPGTRFVKADLDKAGVPQAILEKLFSNQYVKDPLLNYLPHNTNFYSVNHSGTDEFSGIKKYLTVTIYEVPRYGIYATPEKKAQYGAEVKQWITSLGLNPDDYTLVFTT